MAKEIAPTPSNITFSYCRQFRNKLPYVGIFFIPHVVSLDTRIRDYQNVCLHKIETFEAAGLSP